MKNSKKKILITDDSEINRSILSDMLEDEFGIILPAKIRRRDLVGFIGYRYARNGRVRSSGDHE